VSRRAGEVALLVAIVAVASWLRVAHLGTTSIWWDELIEIATADRPLADTLRIVRDGVGPGSGNGGAMPADYVLLNTYLATVPRPAPAHLEAYFRAPACAASIAAVAALYLLGRALFGRATGALSALLLATSLPAILYAAEARPYSLMMLGTVLDLAAFVAVVREPGRRFAWLGYVTAGVLYVATGVFAVFVVGAQYLVLVGLGLGRRGARPTLAIVVGSGLVVALVVGGYLTSTPFALTYPRHAVVEPLAVTWESLRYFAGDASPLLVALVVAIPGFVRASIRRGIGPIAVAVLLSFTSLPAIALAIRWKHYYFHARHVMFLLPLFHLVVAAGVLELLRMLDPLRRLVATPATRRLLDASAAAACVLAISVPALRAFLVAPQPSFARTKTLHDLAPVASAIATSVARLPPGERYLLLAERDSPTNVVLATYLEWYGVADRVTFRAPGVPLELVEPFLRRDDGDPSALALRPPSAIYFALRALVGQSAPMGQVPARVTAFGVVGYKAVQVGPDVRRFWNVTLREPRALSPSPPRP